MKKILSLALAALLLIGCVAVLSACKKDKTEKAKVIDIALSEESYAFVVQKGNTELLNKINAYLTQIKSDGTFDAIMNKYFGDGTPAEITSATKDSSKDQLIVATSTGFEPFEMVDAGKYSGVDLEIAAGFAAYLGKELVIDDMQFASVCTSVQEGICDIGMAGLSITPARQAILDFSDSYYSANQVLIVKGDNTEFDDCKTADDVVAILSKKTTATKIGCQTGTTGEIYIDGDLGDEDGYGFAGLPVTKQGFDYAALAVTAMINGEIDYVIVDDAPAKAITKAVNQ